MIDPSHPTIVTLQHYLPDYTINTYCHPVANVKTCHSPRFLLGRGRRYIIVSPGGIRNTYSEPATSRETSHSSAAATDSGADAPVAGCHTSSNGHAKGAGSREPATQTPRLQLILAICDPFRCTPSNQLTIWDPLRVSLHRKRKGLGFNPTSESQPYCLVQIGRTCTIYESMFVG